MPEISVIMAVYNKPGSLEIMEQAVNSILNQSYQDFELILCDDGSTDEAVDYMQSLSKNDSRIQWIRNSQNRGAAHARNKGIQAATGKYIAIMDADDISAQHRLEEQHSFMEKHQDVDFLGCKGEFFEVHPGDDGEQYFFCEKPKKEDFLFTLPYVHASIMYRSEKIKQMGGYDESKKVIRCEDYDLLMRMAAEGMKGVNLPKILYYIRRDEAQYKRRKYRYRIQEAGMRFRGYRKLGLMPKGILFTIKPLLVGLLPWKVLAVLQKKYYEKYQED